MKRAKKTSNENIRKQQQVPEFRGPTKLPGQNPRANDDPSHDQNNDENRQPAE